MKLATVGTRIPSVNSQDWEDNVNPDDVNW